MSYGFKLSRPLYALPQIVCTSWLVTEWPQTKTVTVCFIPQMGESRPTYPPKERVVLPT